ncbi:uncharacterized protein [Salminus brasiliensis]|uniref:uncharacterized protein n=1 Tax=Salminus brasiliensis TaxID=930266 RepID=UPI003B839256
MTDPVSKFQAEVAAVMELLLKVAVMEITKVFEGRSVVSQDCVFNGEAKLHEDLRCLPDLRAFGERASRNPGKAVCSVGVQVGEPSSPPESYDESNRLCLPAHQMGEGLPPTENPSLDLVETIDVQCTVDLPCNMFKEKVAKGEIGEDLAVEADWFGNSQAELSVQQYGPESPNPLHNSLPSLLCSATASADLILNSSDQSGLVVIETDSAQPVKELAKVELLEGAVNTEEPSQALDTVSIAATSPSDSSSEIVRFQLSQTPFDCKLLQPCSVQLVNLLLVSDAKKRLTNVPGGKGLSTMPKDLRTHQHVHTGRRLCCYTECGDGVWCLQGSLAHKRSLGCKICGKKFKRRKILRRHERFHTGEKPYACRKCNKTFALRKSLRRHERFHTGERPHSCPQCGKCFRLRDSLKAHLRFHTGEKPFTCDLCTKQFRIQRNLHKHASVHSVSGEVYSDK